MYRRALDAFDSAGEGGSLDRALTLENIAVMLRAQGRYAESEKLHRDALPRLEELTGPDSLATMRAVRNLAALYWSSGKVEQAESLRLACQRTRFRTFRPPARRTVRQIARFWRRSTSRSIVTPTRKTCCAARWKTATRANSVTAYSNLAAAALGVRENAQAEEYSRRALEAAHTTCPRAIR